MSCFFSSKRSPPSSTRTYTLFPYTTLFRSTVRPMKGTAPRHADPALDQQAAQELLNSAKNRAENLMIVDLLRNDLGRLATPGSVQVENLFTLERYPSVWTLTSTVTAQAPDRSEERRVGKECAVRVDLGGRHIRKKKSKSRT